MPKIEQRLPRRMTRLILPGFVVLICLMAVLTASSVLHMRAQDKRVSMIVDLHYRKIQLATNLLDATHNRHNSLVYQAIVEDPFDQDEHFQQYIKSGYDVGKARNDLRNMALDAFETDILSQQDELVKEIVVLHETISDLARRGLAEQARAMIALELRPYNLRFIDIVGRLERYEREKIRAALDEANAASQRAVTVNMTLGTVLILLACAIAYLTWRQLNRYAGTIVDQMLALEETGTQLKHEASHDALTGLPNRSLFYHRLQEAMVHARQESMKTTVIYVDLDDFKPVNDLHGHAVGDRLLQVVAGRLLSSVRNTDTVARLGGDEFAIILLGMGEPEQVAHTEREIKQNMQVPLEVDGISIQPGCSCGHAIFPDDGATMDALLNAADARMYEIKRAKKSSR